MFENLVVLPSDFAVLYPKIPDYPEKKRELKEFLLQNYPYKFLGDIVSEAYLNDDDDIGYVSDAIEVFLNTEPSELDIPLKLDFSYIRESYLGMMLDFYRYLHKQSLLPLLVKLVEKHPTAYCKELQGFPEYMQNIP